MRDKKILNRRQWLRPLSSWGPSSTIITNVSRCRYSGDAELDGSIALTDCNNGVSFDLSADNDRKHELQLAMLVKFIAELSLVRDAWVK